MLSARALRRPMTWTCRACGRQGIDNSAAACADCEATRGVDYRREMLALSITVVLVAIGWNVSA